MGSVVKAKFGARASARMIRRSNAHSGVAVGGNFGFICWTPVGPAREALEAGDREKVRAFYDNNRQHHEIKWIESGKNLVTTEGLQHILDILFVSGTSQIDPWYVRLTDSTPTVAAADTLSSHGGWAEILGYTEASGPVFNDVRVAQSVANSATAASYAISTTTATIGGAFLASVSTGTGGTLLCAVAFTGGDKVGNNGDTLEVTYSFGAADA